MYNYRPGELDKRVIIRREVETPDGYGGFELTTQDITTVWAKVTRKAGRESFDSDRVQASASCSFVIRYRSDLSEKDRLVFAGVEYNIISGLDQGGRDLYLEIEAERGVAQ